MSSETTTADIGVILTDPFDTAALLETLDQPCEVLAPTHEDPNFYIAANIRVSSSSHGVDLYRAVLVQGSKLNQVGVAMVVKDLVRSFRVRHVVLLGVATGIRRSRGNSLCLGDVVVSDARGIARLSDGAKVDEGNLMGSSRAPPSRTMVGGVNHLLVGQYRGKKPWQSYILRASKFCSRPLGQFCESQLTQDDGGQDVESSYDLSAVPAPSLHSGLLVAPPRGKISQNIIEECQRRGILALESEASGVADAVWDQTEVSDYIAIRGIAAFAGEDSDRAWREYASLAAASCFRALIDLRPFPSQTRAVSYQRAASRALPRDPSGYEGQLNHYLEWLAATTGELTVRTPETILSASIEKAYVSLNVLASNVPQIVALDADSKHMNGVNFLSLWPKESALEVLNSFEDGGMSLSSTPAVSVLDSNPTSVIIGEAGSGKTTVLRFIAHRLATILLTGREPEENHGIVGAVPIPVFMSLSAYSQYLVSLPPDALPGARSLLRFASWYPEHRHACLDLKDDFFETLLRSGRPVALLLDDIDEISQPDLQLFVGRDLEDLSYAALPLSILATARASGYRGTAVLSPRFQRYRLPSLTSVQVDLILERMTNVFEKAPDIGKAHLEKLRDNLQRLETRRLALREANEQLVTTPLMTQLLFTLGLRQDRVPARRSEFLSEYINVVLNVSYHPDVITSLKLLGPSALRPIQRRILRRLAFEIHVGLEGSQGSVSRAKLHALVCDEIQARIQKDDTGSVAEQIIAALSQRSGLVFVDGGRVAFNHLAFQEVLVGEYLAAELSTVDRIIAFLEEKGRIETELWHDAIGHSIAFISDEDVSEAARMVERMLATTGNVCNASGRRLVVLAESCVEHSFGRKLDLMVANAICERLFSPPSLAYCDPELAARLGTLLGYLGDPRLKSGEPMMIDVEAGEFSMGHPQAPELIDLPSLQSGVYSMATGCFRIAARLVTNAEYSKFVDAGGYASQSKRFWSDAGWSWRTKHQVNAPAFWESSSSCPNHPVVGISWFEALAYCRWLSIIFDRQFRLPTEAEWERAAQGSKCSSWPWGEIRDHRRSNTLELGLGQTTSVGLFPEGASGFGLLDAAGNVWEWCNSEYRTYSAYNSSDGRESVDGNMPRCIRGGSWLNNLDRARVANRDHYNPSDQHSDLGFRLAEDWHCVQARV